MGKEARSVRRRQRPKPHKIAIAAISLAVAVRREAHQRNEAQQSVYTLALGMQLDEVANAAHTYAFHAVDQGLLDAAAATLSGDADDLQHESLLDWDSL